LTDLNFGRFFSEKNVKYERLKTLYEMKWSEQSVQNYFELGVPVTADNFLFAFNYVPPEIEHGKPILFVHSAPVDLSKAWLSRLMVLYPEFEFIILKSASAEFSMDSQRVSFVNFPDQRIDKNYFETIGGGELK
jgi:hypothetical protein